MALVSIIVDGSKIPVLGLSVVESINVYYHYINFTSQVWLGKRQIQVKLTTIEDYRIVSTSFGDTGFFYTAVPEKVVKLLNSVYTEFTGLSTVQSLCAKVGIPFGDLPPTNAVFWMIPRCRLSKLLSLIGNYASVSNGGGCRAFVDLRGRLNLVDLRYVFTKKQPIPSYVEVKSDVTNMDWYLDYSGEVNVITGKLNNVSSSQLRLQDGFSKSTVWVNDTTGHSKDLVIQGATNQFWYHYYSSRKVVANFTSGSADLGDVLQVNDIDQKFLVSSKVTSFDSGADVKSISLELISYVKNN